MKLFLITALLYCFVSGFGQVWCPGGASWYYGTACVAEGGDIHYQYAGDTVILGVSCRIITGKNRLQLGNTSFLDTSATNTIYTYALRDTVYCFDGIAFKPYLYFNAQRGDTIQLPGYSFPLLAYVDSNGLKTVYNELLRYYKYHFINYCDSLFEIEIVERIGPVNTDFFPVWEGCDIDGSCSTHFNCYTDDAFPVFAVDSAYGCYDRTLETSDIGKTGRIKIIPNPATGVIVINYMGVTDEVSEIEVLNELGQLVYTQHLSMYSGFQRIDVSGIAAGLYMLVIKRNTEVVAVQKLVKE